MIRLAIVDDQASMRRSLRDYLQSCPGMAVVAEGSNGAQAAQIAGEVAPDVLLMDLAMPGQHGVDALAAIRSRAPGLPVLILSGHPEEFYALMLLQRGAAGFLQKNCEPAHMVEAIHAVAAGRLYITTQLARDLRAKASQGAAAFNPDAQATVAAALAEHLHCSVWPPACRPSVHAAAAA